MNEQLVNILNKKEDLERIAGSPRVRVYTNSNFFNYLKKALDELFNDIANVVDLEDNTEYIKNHKDIDNLRQMVLNISNDLKNALLLKPINNEFHDFIQALCLFLGNWNNIYNDTNINDNLMALVSLSSTVKTLPQLIEKFQINMEHMQNMLNAKERNNPLTYRTSSSYLAAIKKSFEKNKE